jgi:hypothetical protein
MDKKHLKFIKAIEDLRTIIMKSTQENSVDFLLQDLEQQAAENRKKLADLGFWTEDGEYIEDYQEITAYDTL